MERTELFTKVNELTGKYPNLSKDETKELIQLTEHLSIECSIIVYNWRK